MSDPKELLDAYAARQWAPLLPRAPRTEHYAPKAFAALRKVLERHKPIPFHCPPGKPFMVCSEEDHVSWPCPTVQDITTELEREGSA